MAQIMNGAEASVMDDGYNDYADVQTDFGYSNMAVPMGFSEMACMSFDHRENLLWVVDKSGHVLSYYRVVLQVYSRFFWPLDKNDTEAHSIIPTSDHVIVIGKCTIAAFSRGGVPEYFYRSDLLTDLSCAHWDPYTNLLFLGGSQDTIVVYDIEIRSERNVIPLKEGSASIIRTTERYLVSASDDGKLTVRSKDLMNYNLIAQTQAHLGKVVDFDVHSTYLVCCGMSKKTNGMLVFDNFLKVYDVRNLNPQIPIPFNRHPTVCKFVGIDSLNEEKVVVTSGPMLFLVDILENKLTGLGSLPVQASHLCASDSHQAIAVGMGECPPMVQLFWTEDEDPPFSICDIDPIFPVEDEKDIPIPYDAPTPLATFPLRYCPGMDYCSDRWPDVLMRRRFLKTALDFDTEKAQAMGYIKSPYAQTLVAGFNVWQFDDEEDPVIKKREKPRVLQTITNIEDKEQDLFPCRDKKMIIGPISTQKPIEVNQLSAQFNSTSIMSRFQDAPEFVPGRSLHTSHANLDETRRLTPEPQSTQKKDISIEKSASNKSLNVETENQKPSADRLPNMSFDELRILAAEMRKQKEKSAEAEEGKDENKEELKEKEEEDS